MISLEESRPQKGVDSIQETAEEGGAVETAEDQDGDDDDWRTEAQERLVKSYTEMITTAHAEGCPWKRKGCDGKIDSYGPGRLHADIRAEANGLQTPFKDFPSSTTPLLSPI